MMYSVQDIADQKHLVSEVQEAVTLVDLCLSDMTLQIASGDEVTPDFVKVRNALFIVSNKLEELRQAQSGRLEAMQGAQE